jgi:hypothetical protein
MMVLQNFRFTDSETVIVMRKLTGRLLGAIEAAKESATAPSVLENSGSEPQENAPISAEIFYQRMLDRDIYIHISEISVAMIGVCLTGVSVLQIDEQPEETVSYVDDLLALDSFVFLTACLLAYWAVRVVMKGNRHVRRVANIANLIFLFGMIVMAIVCACIALQGDYTFGLSTEK